jgi:hypothetical protein
LEPFWNCADWWLNQCFLGRDYFGPARYADNAVFQIKYFAVLPIRRVSFRTEFAFQFWRAAMLRTPCRISSPSRP